MSDDLRFMSIALKLARRGLGNTCPNPAVGCVITRMGSIVSRGWTAPGGRPHAEVVALRSAGAAAAGSTVYVTLEPCCHYGVTGPCVDELISAGVRRVVIAANDPDARVSGMGARALTKAGIEVKFGVMQRQAEALNVGFFHSKIRKRPFIAVKLATTLDGKIALPQIGERWITNELTRRWVHKQRSMYGGIMVGSNTVIADNPMLDCRLPGLEQYSPLRIVIDRSGKLCTHHRIVATAGVVPTYIVTDNYKHRIHGDVKYITVDTEQDFLRDVMRRLTWDLGITRLFVEGGGRLVTELLKRQLVDRLIWCRASRIYGAGVTASIADFDPSLGAPCRFEKVETLMFEDDTVDIFDAIAPVIRNGIYGCCAAQSRGDREQH
ncbi:MAG: bifunctional diaminohydroxyphosphoribosylaminopyrimidine deaminase/5-amino-6-(5-phosphoribosylamino)uracil reductase RibD [Anaplasma sp.]